MEMIRTKNKRRKINSEMFEKNEFTYKILTYVAFFLVVQDHQLYPIDINRCFHMNKFFHLLFVSMCVPNHSILIRYLMLMTNLVRVALESEKKIHLHTSQSKKKIRQRNLFYFILTCSSSTPPQPSSPLIVLPQQYNVIMLI